MEEESFTVSGNGLELTETVNSHVENLILSFTIDGQEYITRLDDAAVRSEEYNAQLNEKLDRVIELLETVSANSLPAETEEAAAEDPIPVDVTVTVSENTVSENTVENALITTPLSEFSVTDSLLVIIILLLIVTNFFTFLFRRGGNS